MSEPRPPLPDPVRTRLEALDAQFSDIEAKLSDETIVADHRAVRELSIQRAALAPLIDFYRRHRALTREAQELREALAGDDADLASLARDRALTGEGKP